MRVVQSVHANAYRREDSDFVGRIGAPILSAGCLATSVMRQSAMMPRRIQREREFHAKRAKESGYIKEEGSVQTQDLELYSGMKTNLFGKLVFIMNYYLYCYLYLNFGA